MQINPDQSFAIIIKSTNNEPELLQSFPPKDEASHNAIEKLYGKMIDSIATWSQTIFKTTQLHPAIIKFTSQDRFEVIQYL
jgi:hypothetical protein